MKCLQIRDDTNNIPNVAITSPKEMKSIHALTKAL